MPALIRYCRLTCALLLAAACRPAADDAGARPEVRAAFVVPDTATFTEGGAPVALTVTLTAPLATDVQLPLAVGGTAIEGVDYRFPDGRQVRIAAGQTAGTLRLEAINNTVQDPADRTVQLVLATPLSGTPRAGEPATVTMRLLDDESGDENTVNFVEEALTVNLSADTLVALVVTLRVPLAQTLTVPFALGGTAQVGVHYLAPNPATFVVAAGALRDTVYVRLRNGARPDDLFTLTATLLPPAGVPLGTGRQATVRLINPRAQTRLWAPDVPFPQLYGYHADDTSQVPATGRVNEHFVLAVTHPDSAPNVIGFANPSPGGSTNAFNLIRRYADQGVTSGSAGLRVPHALRLVPDEVGSATGRVVVPAQTVTLTRTGAAGGGTFDVGISGGGRYDETTGLIRVRVVLDERAIGGAAAVVRHYVYASRRRPN